jgi:hypothetical protein
MSGIFQTLLGSLAGVVKDTFFRYVTLLLPGNGTNGAQNNTFTDASTNNFSITRNGNTTQGTFSPYGSNWSNYFDGTGDYLTVADNAAFDFGTGDFTIECWAYISAQPDSFTMICATEGPNQYWGFGPFSTGGMSMYAGAGGTDIYSGPASVPALNQWNHLVWQRSSGVASMYLNGTRVYNNTYTADFGATATGFRVGASPSYPVSYYTAGYVSSLRVVKGTGVYSGASITVPTAPLTAITNTSLLTCQNNRFIDNSTNAFAITRNGDVSVQRFSPFSPTGAYSASAIGGSGYFDGTGDYLTLPTGNLLLSNSDFSFEAWVYLTAAPSTAAGIFYGQGDGASVSGSSYGFLVASATTSDVYVGGTTYGVTSPNPSLNTWTHVAYVRTGGAFSTYLNGTRVGTRSDLSTSSVNNGSTTNAPTIGAVNAGGTYRITGYISNARAIIGSGGYNAASATITVPTAPLTAITNTQLLLNFTNAGIIDNAMMNDLETVGNAQISTAQSKFGGSSMLFDETGDYLTVPVSTNMSLGTGDFTIECWVRFAVTPVGNGQGIYQLSNGYLNSQVRGPGLGAENSTGEWTIYHGTTFTQSTGNVPAINTWYHTAIVRSSGTTKLYVDGTSIISVADTTNYTDQYFVIGGWFSTGFLFNGYIDDLRITKGVARYTATFTPPAAAFPTS